MPTKTKTPVVEAVAKVPEPLKVMIVEEDKHTNLISDNPQFKAFATSIDYGVIVGDKKGYIIDFNQAALDIFGYKEEELRGKPITTIMPQRFREAHVNGMSRYNKTKQGRNLGKTLRLYGLGKNGKEFPIEIALSSWKDVDGEQYFTASLRRYSTLENNLGWILMSAAIMTVVMLAVFVYLLLGSY